MRKPRCQVLPQEGGLVHEMWQIHNKAHKLKEFSLKYILFKCLKFSLFHKKTQGLVRIQAFCFMDNHCHQIVKYEGKSNHLSTFMKLMNGEFSRYFHLIFKSSGAVNNGRPKTVLLDPGTASDIRAHLYVEANPIRSRTWKLENLHFNVFNSYRFYALGIMDDFTSILTPPRWYLNLGNTALERQRKYRKLFRNFLKQYSSNNTHQASKELDSTPNHTWKLGKEAHSFLVKINRRLDRLIFRTRLEPNNAPSGVAPSTTVHPKPVSC